MTEAPPLSEDVMNAIRAGRKIQAIKTLRIEQGLGLKDAKTIIDREMADYRRTNPNYALESQESSGLLPRVILLLAGAAMFYFLFRG